MLARPEYNVQRGKGNLWCTQADRSLLEQCKTVSDHRLSRLPDSDFQLVRSLRLRHWCSLYQQNPVALNEMEPKYNFMTVNVEDYTVILYTVQLCNGYGCHITLTIFTVLFQPPTGNRGTNHFVKAFEDGCVQKTCSLCKSESIFQNNFKGLLPATK